MRTQLLDFLARCEWSALQCHDCGLPFSILSSEASFVNRLSASQLTALFTLWTQRSAAVVSEYESAETAPLLILHGFRPAMHYTRRPRF